MNRQGTYIYGSAARELVTEPARRRDRPGQRNVPRSPGKRQKPKQRVDKVAVLFICLTIAAVMTIGIAYLHLQFESTYLSKSVVDLQSEVMEMEKENTAASMKLENKTNLSEIYKKATEGLGMREAKEDQIYTYESKKSTQIRQHGSIPTE